jgi:hypothetical protein
MSTSTCQAGRSRPGEPNQRLKTPSGQADALIDLRFMQTFTRKRDRVA